MAASGWAMRARSSTFSVLVAASISFTAAASFLATAKRYSSLEQKAPVVLDRDETERLVTRLIQDDYVTVKNHLLRHNVLKLGMHIFGYLLEG